MADFNGKTELELTDKELTYFVKRYRYYSFTLLGLGAATTLYLVYQENESDLFVFAYCAFMIILVPILLRSNALHRELKNRYYEKRRKERSNNRPKNLTIKIE